MSENERWRWFQIEMTYEYQVQMNIQDKEKTLENLRYVWNWEKKDTILLYRNPFMRIKSGILQKVESWYKKSLVENEKGQATYNLSNDIEKDFSRQLKVLNDDFSTIFPHIHMKDNHCTPWSTYSLQLLDDLKITPKVYINLDLKEGNRNEYLDKWLKAVGSEEEIKRIDNQSEVALNSNNTLYRLFDEFDLDQKIEPLITQELTSYNILEHKRCKL